MVATQVTGRQIGPLDVTTEVTGTLPVANGGTGASSITGAGIVDTSTAQTLSNKTLTSPKIDPQLLDANGNAILYMLPKAAAVNSIGLFNNSAGGNVGLQPIGADTDIGFVFYTKGNGESWTLDSADNFIIQNRNVAGTTVNYPYTKNAATGNAPVYGIDGTDTNINLNLQPKGTGVAQVNGVEVATISGTQTLTGKTVSDTFMGDVFDAQKTQRDTVLLASNDFAAEAAMEIASTTSLEIPSTSTLEIITYPGRRIFGQSVAATAVTINTDVYERYLLSGLAAGVTVTLSGMGGRVLIGFKDNGTSRAITWANAQSSGVATLLAATVINKTHWVGLIHDGSTWTALAVDATGY